MKSSIKFQLLHPRLSQLRLQRQKRQSLQRKKDGKSIRAEEQARRLNLEAGQDFDTRIKKDFPTKREAYEYENRAIKRVRGIYGKDKLPGNKGEH
jgi:hypothetical protein